MDRRTGREEAQHSSMTMDHVPTKARPITAEERTMSLQELIRKYYGLRQDIAQDQPSLPQAKQGQLTLWDL